MNWWYLALLPTAVVTLYGAHVKNAVIALLGLAMAVVVAVGSVCSDVQDFEAERTARHEKQMADIAAVYAAVEDKYDVDVDPHGYPNNVYETWTIDGVEHTCRLAGDDLEENAKDPVLTCVVQDAELSTIDLTGR